MEQANKLIRCLRWLPAYAFQRLARHSRPGGAVDVIVALADHFEPAILPENIGQYAPLSEQERRLERWCKEYPQVMAPWRDSDGRPFVHTYFYPAEQYNAG